MSRVRLLLRNGKELIRLQNHGQHFTKSNGLSSRRRIDSSILKFIFVEQVLVLIYFNLMTEKVMTLSQLHGIEVGV